MIKQTDNQTDEPLEFARIKIMMKKILYASLEALGLISILFGMLAVYKGAGLHDLWIEFITKLI